MRDIFLQMAADDVFRAKWTEDIHREWIDALIRNEPHRDRATLEHTGAACDLSRCQKDQAFRRAVTIRRETVDDDRPGFAAGTQDGESPITASGRRKADKLSSIAMIFGL